MVLSLERSNVSMAEKEIKKIALVISGGTCRGAAQVAFINELIKKIGLDRLCVISASSIGAFTAYATGVGRTEELMDAYGQLDSDSISHFIKRVKSDLFNKVFNKIEDELKVPTYVTVTRVWGLDCGYYCLNSMPRKDLKQAINASMGLPIFNGPLRFNKHICIDGGATDNIPVLPATYFDPDMIIIMHCFSRYYPPQWLYEQVKPGTIIIDFDISLNFPKDFSPFSFSKTDMQYFIEQGTKDGKEFADKIFEDFDADKVRERCFEYTNSKMEIRKVKYWNGYMHLVEMLNALYQIKEGRI